MRKIKVNLSHDLKRLASNFLSLSGLQIFTYILPLLTLPYLVKVLGVDKYGLVMFAQSIIIIFNIFVDYGFNLSATRDISINRDNDQKIIEIFSSVVMIKIISTIILFFTLLVSVYSFDRFYDDRFLYLLTYLFVIGHAVFPVWYFQGLECMKYITIINIFSRVLFTAAIFIFVHQESDYLLVPLFNGLGVVVGGCYAMYLVKRSFRQVFIIQKPAVLISYFKESTSFFLSRISVSVYTSANSILLGFSTSNTIVGYYSIAEKLYQAIQALYGPATQALYPYIAKERNVILFKKIFYLALFLNSIVIVFLFGFSDLLFDVFFSRSLGGESKAVFQVLLIASFFTVPSVLLGYPFLAALGFTSYANNSVILGSIIHLIGLVFLVMFNHVTIYNVAFMVVFTEIFVFLFRVYGVKKNKLWSENC